MQVKLSDFVVKSANGDFVVIKAMNEFLKNKLPLKYKFLLTDILNEITPKISNFQERHLELLKEHGTEILNEQGAVTGYIPHKEKEQFVIDELTKMADIDIELPYEKIKRQELHDVETSDDSIKWLSCLFEK